MNYNTTRAKRYLAYLRKSSDGEDRQVQSIPDQLTWLGKACEKLGLLLSEVEIVIETRSAKKPGRPEFNRACKLIRLGKCDGILCWALHRLSRNPTDAGTLLQFLEDESLVHIICNNKEYTVDSDISEMYSEFGRANESNRSHKRDVQRGVRSKGRQGWFPYPNAPLGYKHINKHLRPELGIEEHIINDEERFPIIQGLWKKRLKGYSVKQLHTLAVKKGLTGRKGQPIKYSSLYTLFKCEFYAGYFSFREEDGSYVRVKGKHKPMITERQFKLIQERSKNNRSNQITLNSDYQFKGLIQCGECKRGIIREIKEHTTCTGCWHKFSSRKATACNKCNMPISDMVDQTKFERTYYHCSGKKYGCRERVVEHGILQKQVKTIISDLGIDQPSYEKILTYAGIAFDIESQEAETTRIQLKKRKTELQNQIKGLGAYAYDVGMSKTDYETTKVKLSNESKRITLEEQNLGQTRSEFLNQVQKETSFITDIKTGLLQADNEADSTIVRNFRNNLALSNKSLVLKDGTLLKDFSEAILIYREKDTRKQPRTSISHKGKTTDSAGAESVVSFWCTKLKLGRTKIKRIQR